MAILITPLLSGCFAFDKHHGVNWGLPCTISEGKRCFRIS
ncbi:TPA: hypothetical protein ACH3IE_004299 [Salmonella enterica subsp. enterica serovar Paratyphi B]